jgi:predicted dehydrogenase
MIIGETILDLKLGIIGCGVKASQYIATWIERVDVEIVCIADNSADALSRIQQLAINQSKPKPYANVDWREMLEHQSDKINSVYICTPHAAHAEQAIMALNLGLDVLLEKPMVTTVAEAEALQQAQQKSGKELVVAYQGGLSPLVHQLKKDIKLGTYGKLVSLSANIWENWADTYTGHWKQMPEISGGGFMFDTGAHLMNTTSMLCDKEFASISALMQNRGKPVDIVTAVMGQLTDGTLFTMQACGETIGCTSRIECYFSQYIIRICAWGRWMEIEDSEGNITRQEQESANNLINIFQQTLKSEIENPSAIKQGLKMAVLWDAIKESASNNGQAVTLG